MSDDMNMMNWNELVYIFKTLNLQGDISDTLHDYCQARLSVIRKACEDADNPPAPATQPETKAE